jgi:hypothetical protein
VRINGENSVCNRRRRRLIVAPRSFVGVTLLAALYPFFQKQRALRLGGRRRSRLDGVYVRHLINGTPRDDD